MADELEDTGLVSRTFLSVFFLDINNLKDSLTGYRSIILRLNESQTVMIDGTAKTLQKLDDETKNSVIQWSDSVRHNVERCQISIEAILDTIPTLTKEQIDSLKVNYDAIMKQFVPELLDVSLYVFDINKIFIQGTLEKVMKRMENFYAQFKE